MKAKMLSHNDQSLIKWLELAVSPSWQDMGAVAMLRPIQIDERLPCFGVTLDQRWLCGSDGTLTFFDSVSTATRFLNLLHVDRIAVGESCDGMASRQMRFQCFQLCARGLKPCHKCQVGEAAYSRATVECARAEERW